MSGIRTVAAEVLTLSGEGAVLPVTTGGRGAAEGAAPSVTTRTWCGTLDAGRWEEPGYGRAWTCGPTVLDQALPAVASQLVDQVMAPRRLG